MVNSGICSFSFHIPAIVPRYSQIEGIPPFGYTLSRSSSQKKESHPCEMQSSAQTSY